MDPYESPLDLVNVLLMSGYKSVINQRCFFSLDLREQRVRAQRLHPSGEREEERLRAVRHSGNDLKHLRQDVRQERDGQATQRSEKEDPCKDPAEEFISEKRCDAGFFPVRTLLLLLFCRRETLR